MLEMAGGWSFEYPRTADIRRITMRNGVEFSPNACSCTYVVVAPHFLPTYRGTIAFVRELQKAGNRNDLTGHWKENTEMKPHLRGSALNALHDRRCYF